jgi:UDP-glucose 4-epimerase
MACILVTGGCGYIGSHTCVELLSSGYEVVVIDDLRNGHAAALERVEHISSRKVAALYVADIGDARIYEKIFSEHDIQGVIHFAALKSVSESVQQPLEYYRNNLTATLTLCDEIGKRGIRRLVFSSSATVYGDPQSVPIAESAPIAATNPYGWSKVMCERILQDLCRSDPAWQVVLLRYFNPVGAHPSGLIGEDPHGIPNNLMPFVTQVAAGKLPELQVFGNDYPTADGTGVRDYIHVMDLARGHVRALELLNHAQGLHCFNLGTGTPYSVLEVIRQMEAASGKKINYRFAPRRPGDIAACWADVSKAERELGWSAECTLAQMCEDAWRWQLRNPDGYRRG